MTKLNIDPTKIKNPRLVKTLPKIVTDALVAKTKGNPDVAKVKAPRVVKAPPKVVTDTVKPKNR